MNRSTLLVLVGLLTAAMMAATPSAAAAAEKPLLELLDIFELEYVADPRISPDGEQIVYERRFMDVLKDRVRSDLWLIDSDGTNHRPLVTGVDASMARWSPDGTRLAYRARDGEHQELFVYYLKSGVSARLAQLPTAPDNLSWSPDGERIAFSRRVEEDAPSLVDLPKAPKGAEWAPPPQYIEAVLYREDGEGFLPAGYHQLFVVRALGGTPRQLTHDPFHHRGTPSWTPDGKTLILSANRSKDWQYDGMATEIYALDVESGSLETLTQRKGPDTDPQVSPDGRSIAYLGFDDTLQGYQVTGLYVMDRDGSNPHPLAAALDRDIENPQWSSDSKGLFVQFDDLGETKIGYVSLEGDLTVLSDAVGGTSLGRPYSGGSFTVSRDDRFAYTQSAPEHPAELAVGTIDHRGPGRRLTHLSEALLGSRSLGAVSEITYRSSYDKRRIQGWVIKPPGFDPNKKYPLILEIHGGPFANYGPRFTAELQLYAARGYVVLYVNPRGSTSYGAEFGNLIHHAYPSHDYDDLMSGVDALIAQGFIDDRALFVTGGSGGGVLTAWIVGHTNRFRAAVVAKPVINWISWQLTSDIYTSRVPYWLPDQPWNALEHYWKRSPLAYVGNVKTPTMLLTGENDRRTPMAESEQFFQALQLLKVPTALVRVPGASHGIARRPSHLMAKVAYVLGWFERYAQESSPEKM